jgi:NAD(P)H-hydrate epimerase
MTAGDPGMATAGSGDVLAGIITSFLAQKMSPFSAAALGTYVHGRAGELASEAFTSYSLMARDLIHYLPQVFKEMEKLTD